MRRRIVSLAEGLALLALPAWAQRALTIGVGGAFSSMDPHYFNLGPNNVLTNYVFEPLARFNPKFQPEPSLAESWKAIPGIRDHIMDGLSAPTGQVMPEGASGYDPSIKADPYDPAAAKTLLGAAGYPNGFALTLHGPNDRYVNDRAIVEAIAQMWTRIGIKTAVETMPAATYFPRAVRAEFSIRLSGWASDTGEASSPLIELLASSNPEKGRGAVLDPSHYANPAVDAIVEQSLATIDTAAREALYRQAEQLAMADAAIIPIHHQVNIWAIRKELVFHMRMQEGTRAWDIEPQ